MNEGVPGAAPPGTLQRLFEAPGGVVVDALRATPTLSAGDVIMVRGRGERGFSVYAQPVIRTREAIAQLCLREASD